MSYNNKCLHWFCFCVYNKDWSREYSTIESSSSYWSSIMTNKSNSLVDYGACKNCPVLEKSSNENCNKTAAMVSQAEVWQEEKKFTVNIILNI